MDDELINLFIIGLGFRVMMNLSYSKHKDQFTPMDIKEWGLWMFSLGFMSGSDFLSFENQLGLIWVHPLI